MLITLFRDKLPSGLCFPIGLEPLNEYLPIFRENDVGVFFVWQSTWAAQIYNPQIGQDGKLTILQMRKQQPYMRINRNKVKVIPKGCYAAISEYAVSSDLRKCVLDAFIDSGAALVLERIRSQKIPSLQLLYEISSNRFVMSAYDQTVW